MIKVAIIGAGYIGGVNANACDKTEDAKVVAVVDKDFQKAKLLAQKINAEPYNSLEEILIKKEIDVVGICTPTFLHADMVEKCAKASKHIFCEKPVALSIEEVNRMIQAIKKYKVKSMVGHVLRFWPEYETAKRIIKDNFLGCPKNMYCERLGVIPEWAEGEWNKDKNLGGGAALDLQIHDLDYMISVFGDPLSVASQGIYDENLGGWAHMSTIVKFAGGQYGCVNAGWAVKGKFPFTMLLRIICEKGTIEWISRASANISETLDGKVQKNEVIVYKDNGEIIKETSEEIDPFFSQWKYFIHCINNDKEVENSTFEDGKRSLELALASMDSSEQNKIVYINKN